MNKVIEEFVIQLIRKELQQTHMASKGYVQAAITKALKVPKSQIRKLFSEVDKLTLNVADFEFINGVSDFMNEVNSENNKLLKPETPCFVGPSLDKMMFFRATDGTRFYFTELREGPDYISYNDWKIISAEDLG